MKIIFYLFIFSMLIFFNHTDGQAQDWKKLIPIKSNCEDAKQVLKINKCDQST